MNDGAQLFQLAQTLGATGILALALVVMARAIAPAIDSLANARREATEAAKQMRERWAASDAMLTANTAALQEVVTNLARLNAASESRDAHALQAHTRMETAVLALHEGREKAVTDIMAKVDGAADDQGKRLDGLHAAVDEVRAIVGEVRAKVDHDVARRLDDIMAALRRIEDTRAPAEPPAAPAAPDAGAPEA